MAPAAEKQVVLTVGDQNLDDILKQAYSGATDSRKIGRFMAAAKVWADARGPQTLLSCSAARPQQRSW
jgi:hypothetical protein